MSSGDIGYVINGQLAGSSDPQFESAEKIASTVMSVFKALSVPFEELEINTPAAKDWTWADTVEKLKENNWSPA